MPNRDTYLKADVAEELAARFKMSRENAEVVFSFALGAMRAALEAGLNLEFREFGKFELKPRKAKVGRNPLYPERGDVVIPARTVVVFKPIPELAKKLRNL